MEEPTNVSEDSVSISISHTLAKDSTPLLYDTIDDVVEAQARIDQNVTDSRISDSVSSFVSTTEGASPKKERGGRESVLNSPLEENNTIKRTKETKQEKQKVHNHSDATSTKTKQSSSVFSIN